MGLKFGRFTREGRKGYVSENVEVERGFSNRPGGEELVTEMVKEENRS